MLPYNHVTLTPESMQVYYIGTYADITGAYVGKPLIISVFNREFFLCSSCVRYIITCKIYVHTHCMLFVACFGCNFLPVCNLHPS